MTARPSGTLIIIGGHEDKAGDCAILSEVARRVNSDGKRAGRLVIVTAATQLPEEVADEYRALFKKLGVRHVDVIDVRTREEAYQQATVEKLADATALFFTGGDQLSITSQIGDSPVFRCMQEIYQRGGTIIGTSAGAAAMPETMLIGGPSDSSHRVSALAMAPGLALISGVVIDSHFAERGRIGRLLGAVTLNPRNIGIGIDEDTAIIVSRSQQFSVLGSGAVYVLDGSGISYSSLSQEQPEGTVSVDDVCLHVLSSGDRFDLERRRPLRDALQPG